MARFRALVEEMRPAWAMIDTEELPPVLNFAVTKEFCDLMTSLGSDAILEAEYGATGQSGDDTGYRRLSGEELEGLAHEVAGLSAIRERAAFPIPSGWNTRRHRP